MIKRSTLLHLRIPFSMYLFPFFLFALCQAKQIHLANTIVACILIHFIFYPATNGYNSYFDKDEGSIGGLKNPPKVDKELYRVSLILDLIAIILGLFISIDFTILLLFIGLASKAYSHPSIRLKKYPFLGLITVAFFQGGYTYFMSLLAIENLSITQLMKNDQYLPALLCSFILLGSYPMTQIYQHEEDRKRGDITASIVLGVKGTFLWTTIVFAATLGGFYFYLATHLNWIFFTILILCLLPVLIFFFRWFYKSWKNNSLANFDKTMKLNKYSSLGFIVFFLIIFIYRIVKQQIDVI